MSITFSVSPEVAPPRRISVIDHAAILRQAFRRPVEALWNPPHPLVACDDDHSLIKAVHDAFYGHHPLILSPDVVWLTLARGFSLHVNLHSENLRHRFVKHSGKHKLVVERRDFLPGRDNPWPEVFEAFSVKVGEHVGKMRNFVRCDFSTTGPVELAAGDLLMMDTFQAYFEYELLCGCGIPAITLTGTVDDWNSIRDRAALFGEFGLEKWAKSLEPVLRQFVTAAEGKAEVDFWRSLFRYHSGSGPAVMTGWINVFFPYFKDEHDALYPNPYLEDWEERLAVDERQHWTDRAGNPQGVGVQAVPSALASAPVKVVWGDRETDMRFVGGLIGVAQHEPDLDLEPQCGWAILYDEPS